MVSHSESLAFGHTVSADLAFRDNLVFLVLVDHATLYTVAAVVNSKSPGDVWPALFHGRITPFGAPINLVTESGGEFKSFTWAQRLSVLDTNMIFKPKCSHARMAEARICLLRKTLGRLLRQFRSHR